MLMSEQNVIRSKKMMFTAENYIYLTCLGILYFRIIDFVYMVVIT